MTSTTVDTYMVASDHYAPVNPLDGSAVVKVLTGDTVYYADKPYVTSTSNLGSLTVGQSHTFTGRAWLLSASLSSVSVTITGTKDDADLDAAAVATAEAASDPVGAAAAAQAAAEAASVLRDGTGMPANVVSAVSGNALANVPVRVKTSQRVRAMRTQGLSTPTFTLDGVLGGGVLTRMDAASPPFVYENIANFSTTSATYYAPTVGGVYAGLGYRVAFDFDGQIFSILSHSENGPVFRVWVNEQPSAWYTGMPNDSAQHTIRVDLGQRAYYRIVIELDPGLTPGNAYFGGLYTLPTDTLFPPSNPPGFKLAIVGDSYARGSGATYFSQGYVASLTRELGTANVLNLSVPGSGWVATAGASLAYTAAARTSELIAAAPDVIFVQGSINDGSAVTAAITAWLATVQAGLPNAQIIFGGVMRPQNATAQDTNRNNEIKAAALAAGIPFVDPLAQPWFHGTGTNSSTTGDGNADYYMTGSGTYINHPTQAGHDATGHRLAREIAVLLGVAAVGSSSPAILPGPIGAQTISLPVAAQYGLTVNAPAYPNGSYRGLQVADVAGNAGEMVSLQVSGSYRALNINMLAASTGAGAYINNAGTGSSLFINHTTPSGTAAALVISNTAVGAAVALSISQQAANSAISINSNFAGAAGNNPISVNGYDYGPRYTTNQNGGVTLWVEKLGTGNGFGLRVDNKGTADTVQFRIGSTPTIACKFTALGSLVVGQGAQLATTATDGFVYLPSCAGAPTGVPTTQTGSSATVYDTTNHKLWVYDAGWKGVVLA